jgi:hypothetical protein
VEIDARGPTGAAIPPPDGVDETGAQVYGRDDGLPLEVRRVVVQPGSTVDLGGACIVIARS